MTQSTGQLDKLIEEKVDEKIRQFSSLITNQIKDFLNENGDAYKGDYLYQAEDYERSNCGSYNVPIDYNRRNINDFWRNLKGGLDLTIKDKMIDRATKDLLNKVSLLS
jgi:hypothetical protein